MRSVQYGTQRIAYRIEEKAGLSTYYISVDAESGVVLKGKHISSETADKLILKKARWIIRKLELVGGTAKTDEIVTGSRITYLGKSYYAEIIYVTGLEKLRVEFNYSRFRIYTGRKDPVQEEIREAIEKFYQQKAIEKIRPRFYKIAGNSKHSYKSLQFRKMSKRWGSCTADNKIIINANAIKLPYTLIDFLIIHELCHTKVKDHSKAFYAELSKHVKNWRELDERVRELRV